MAEIDDVVRFFPKHARILEIGAGTGEQSAELARRGFKVTAVDVVTSNYRADRVFDVADYDGVNLPFPDDSFDVVYSSNVLEHVKELNYLEREIQRVLRPKGKCVHLVPTPAWRLWSALTVFASAAQAGVHMLAVIGGHGVSTSSYWQKTGRAAFLFAGQVYEAIRQSRHGERGNRFTELYYFSRTWWLRHFREAGFEVLEALPGGLFYTGYMAMGPRLSIAIRRRLAPRLGSACHRFVLVVAEDRLRANSADRAATEGTRSFVGTTLDAIAEP